MVAGVFPFLTLQITGAQQHWSHLELVRVVENAPASLAATNGNDNILWSCIRMQASPGAHLQIVVLQGAHRRARSYQLSLDIQHPSVEVFNDEHDEHRVLQSYTRISSTQPGNPAQLLSLMQPLLPPSVSPCVYRSYFYFYVRKRGYPVAPPELELEQVHVYIRHGVWYRSLAVDDLGLDECRVLECGPQVNAPQ
ncbi:uncharacterized protein B0H18DRAFT_1118815 [Fomitopsis serialis]|uniref:uncharacterized protein n=1 Tax=Fomitopsis serialis TaxID=139415 RepID=UPI0020072058|nr:uncharacterized protein B0H18DRAFT_1118815 [Neoantrodia serialis]KAH9926747.1 hypothetical protein B0H18DRAFT_1118815 [Neoantrodia serialis]